MAKKLQGQTITLNNPPQIVNVGTIAGPEESRGPLGDKFDLVTEDPKLGQDSWEKGERKMVSEVIDLTFGKASVSPSDIDIMLAGDLLNEIVTSNYVAKSYDIPYLGLYGACSTLVEALGLGSLFMDGGFADSVLAYTSSHYQTAERQFRYPLEYGVQYPADKQYTVTGAGAYILGWMGGQVQISHITWGKVIDYGRKDPNDMGIVMAPAAADTILQHFDDTNREPQDYDLIVTGDLGQIGSNILNSLMQEKNIDISDRQKDCGVIIFGEDSKKHGAGGSGCAASATVVGSTIIPEIISGNLSRVLVVATGVLHNPILLQQKDTIPAIAHAIVLEKISGE
ncbi:MAG: stage V sporulation protein AD [Halanaerobiales bacterium]